MVRAVLDGRKTVTRRIVKPQPPAGHVLVGRTISSTCVADEGKWVWSGGDKAVELIEPHRVGCPYGQPGDRLWVRETHMRVPHPSEMGLTREMLPHTWDACCEVAGTFLYRADPCSDLVADGRHWTPSIHMPRATSRITLEVTGVRVERLQDITPAQCVAEGALSWAAEQDSPLRDLPAEGARIAFAGLWSATGGDWDANPWVWAVEFKRIEQEPAHA